MERGMLERGMFITLEGGEGAGKSTQARRLADRLQRAGRDVVVTREPGGSPFAERLRATILDGAMPAHGPLTEALLFYAARSDHLVATIRPALERGGIVICDRFSDSTRVYQCHAGGLDLATFETLERLVVGALRPDLTFVLDLPAAEGLQRVRARRAGQGAPSGDDRLDGFERRALAFHEQLRQGFLDIAAADPERCRVVDAMADVETISQHIAGETLARLGGR
jgi:dTMP kinase